MKASDAAGESSSAQYMGILRTGVSPGSPWVAREFLKTVRTFWVCIF